jgi:putative tricarboxylic transport membrane protein
MLPKIMAVLIMICGLVILPRGLMAGRERMTPWRPRGIIAFLGAVVVFGATIRGLELPLGLTIPALGMTVAIPLSMIVAGFGSPETRRGEVIVFVAAITLFCVLLFKNLLGLPIPLAPWLLGY